MSKAYDWKRFWCPRSGKINLAGFGYLHDPDIDFGRYLNPDLVTFDVISHIPCLVLLGEPGIGKSSAINAEKQRIVSKIEENGSKLLWLDLRAYSSEERLIRKLFESPDFQDWTQGDYKLYVFLDSLDECLLRINTLAALLVDELSNHSDKLERLYFRIACRTAEWRSSLEQGLKELWGKDMMGVYELAPLRRVDIASAAQAEGIDNNDFLEAIEQQQVVPLAIKPITLGFLLNMYRKNNSLPTQQTELYLQGCRLLCEETNQHRRDARLTGNLTADQKMVIAARIAAVTIYCNRYAVWMNIDIGDVPAEDIVIRELVGGTEFALGDEFTVTEEAVKEVLSTGLFSSRDSHRMGWAHQTYAEFLAAWYLQHRQLTLEQMMSLIVHPGCSDNKLVPQLHETSAWLSAMNQEVFREVMKTNPDILLNSSIVNADDKVKANLVESLLKLYDEEKLGNQFRINAYTYLKHHNLAAQLQTYICDTSKNETARYIAIEIAQQCKVESLQEDLLNVALAPEQPYWVRVNAADTICQIGDEETKAKLRPLVFGEAGDDPEDELKGYGLHATYPKHLTIDEFFKILTQPKKNVIGGTYQDFVARDIGTKIYTNDLPVALEWVEKQPERYNLHYPFDSLVDTILFKAWEHLDNPEVLNNFARVLYHKLKNHDENIKYIKDYNEQISLGTLLTQDEHKRRQIIKQIVTIVANSDTEENFWFFGDGFVIKEDDFLWFFKKIKESKSEARQKVWAKLIWRFFKRFEPIQVSLILVNSQEIPALKTQFEPLLEPIDLDSLKAKELIQSYIQEEKILHKHRNWQKKNQPKLLSPSPKERIVKLLNQFESGDIDSWCVICKEMTLMLDNPTYNNRLLCKSELTSLPGWKEAESSTKVRIIQAAKVYIHKGNPKTHEWLGTNKFYYSALAGYKAIRLILEEKPEDISTTPVDIWQKWASLILDYPREGDEISQNAHQVIVAIAYQNAPNEIINTLILLIDKENKEHGFVNIHRALNKCWDEKLARAIFDKIQDKNLKHQSFGSLLEELLKHKHKKARTFAESLVSLPLPKDTEQRNKVIAAAKALIYYIEDESWSVIWSVIQQEREFGKQVLESASFSLKYEGSFEHRLKEEYLADLYIFLTQEYPDTEKVKYQDSEAEKLTGIEAYVVKAEDSIKIWKNYIPQRLKDRSTPEACEAIRKIIRELPEEKDKLKRFLIEAEILTRRNTWIPPQPSVIIEMTRSQKSKEMQSLVNHGTIQLIKGSIIGGSVQALTGNNNQQIIEDADTDHKKE